MTGPTKFTELLRQGMTPTEAFAAMEAERNGKAKRDRHLRVVRNNEQEQTA